MTIYGFTKADRLVQRNEFTALTRLGKKIQNSHFIAYIKKSEKGHHRLGITVTKKVGHAAARNRFKRLAREYFRQNRHKFAGGWDMNLIVKKQASTITNTAIFISLENLFDRIAAIHCR